MGSGCGPVRAQWGQTLSMGLGWACGLQTMVSHYRWDAKTNMSGDTELLWLGVALLLLLSGATAGLCVRCSRPGRGHGSGGRPQGGAGSPPFPPSRCGPASQVLGL
jgi:hypothetical protein